MAMLRARALSIQTPDTGNQTPNQASTHPEFYLGSEIPGFKKGPGSSGGEAVIATLRLFVCLLILSCFRATSQKDKQALGANDQWIKWSASTVQDSILSCTQRDMA